MAEYTLRMTSQQNHPPVPHLVPGDRAVLDFPMRGVFAGRQGQDLVFSRTDGGKLVLPGVFAAHTLPGTLPAPGELPGEAPGNLMGKASSLLDTADKPGGTLHLIVHGRDMSLEEFLAALGKEDMPESGMAPSARVRFHEYADAELMHGIGGLGGLELSLSRTGYETAPRYDTLPTRQDKENDQLPARGGLPDTPVPPAHHVPTVDSFAYALAEDGVPDTVSGNALAGAHPGDGNNIFAWVTPPSAARYGSISLNPDGTFTYTIDNSLPIVQELGVGDQVVEHFIYTYTDAAGEKATGSLDISIIGTNDVPTVAASTASVSDSGSAGVPSGVSGILPAPHDPDAHDTVSFLPQNGTPGAYGTFTLHTDGTWSYDLDNNLYAVRALAPGDSLTETFTYTVSDNHGGTSSNTLTVTINGTNDAPAIAAAATSVTEDTQLTTSGTLPAPSDPDRGDTIAFVPQNGTLGHYGSLTLGADGSYSYTLNNNLYAVQSLGAGETLTDTFTYTVTDSHGAIGSNTLTVTINGTNDAPTVAAAIASVAEDAQTTATGTLPTPLDMDTHDSVSFLAQNGTPGTYGTLTLNADGSYAYALDNTSPTVQGLGVGETLTDTFTYTVTDNHGATASNTLTVTIHGTNDAPTVAAAAASVTEETQLTASGILPQPQDIDAHDTVSFIPQTDASGSYGTLTLNADGSYTYTLNNNLYAVQSLGAGETLTDTFTYTVTDSHGAIGSNTLTVTINGTNDAPTVAAAIASVAEDAQTTATGTLPTPLDMDTHDSVSFLAQNGTPGTYGTLTLNADGSYAYALDNTSPTVQGLGVGETLTDTFTYTVTDNHGATASNTLTVTIHGTNDAPTVAAAAASVTEDTQITTSGTLPTPSDTDVHDTVSFLTQSGAPGTYGTFTLSADGSYTYALNNNLPAVQALGVGETLTDTFAYAVTDGHGGIGINTLTGTINGTNDAPTVAAAASSVTEDSQTTASGILPTPQDTDTHDSVSFLAQNGTPGTYGAFTLNADGSYTYILNNSLPAVQSLGVGETLTDTFTYTVTDNHGAIGSNTLTVTIHGTNDAPTVAAAAASVTEDTQITTSGTLPTPQDTDTHDTVSFVAQSGTPGTYGTFTLNADGSYTYVLNNSLPAIQTLGVGETLTDTITYTVSDGHGGTASNTLTVTINGTNDAPTAAAAGAFVTEDTQATASGTLPLPQDPDLHDTVTFIPKTNETGTYGSLNLNADGSYTYALNNASPLVQGLGAGETVTDTFTYTVSDGHGGTASNTLTVTISGTNDVPAVAAAAASVTEDTQISASGTLPQPQDPDLRDTVSFIPKTNETGTYGSLNLNADGSYTYALNNASPLVQGLGAGETVTDTFTYTVSDGHGGTASNTLTVTISGTNDVPAVAAAAASVTEDTQISASGTLPQPQDPDLHDTVAFTPKAGEAGTYGSLTLNADGSYTYTLNNASPLVQGLGAGETVADTFTYTVSDGHGGTASNTLTVTISGTNDAPTVAAATASVAEDTQISASGTLPQPQDADIRDTVAFTPLSNAAGTYGTLTLNADGSYAYTLNNASPAVQGLGAGETATDVFTYTVTDGHGATASNTLTVTIHGTNDAPTVVAAVASVTEDTQILASGTLPVPHDTDTHDTVAFTPKLNETGTYGSLTLNADGTYIYTLNNASPAVQGLGAGETATDVFTYTVTDGHGGTGSNTLTVTIRGTNDIPTVAAATASATEDAQITASGTLPLPQDTDIHDTLTFTTKVAEAGLYGTLTLNADGSYTYTLNNASPLVQGLGAGESVTDAFIYTASDGHGGTVSNTLTVTINGTNDTPSVAAAVASVTEDTKITASGTLPAPQDADIHDTVAFLPQTNTAGLYGSLTLNADGTYTYTLNNASPLVQGLGTGESVTDAFTYTVSDGHGGTASNTLTVTINGTEDLPVLTPATASVREDVQLTASGVVPPPFDADIRDTLTFTAKANEAGRFGTLTLNADGTYTYTLNNSLSAVQALGVGETLTDVFQYTVTDSQGGSSSSTLTVTINGTNDVPTVAASVASVTEDTKITASGILPTPQDTDIHDPLAFTPKVAEAGLYGKLTLAANGSYTYTLNNSLPAVQRLGVGETATDTFTYTVSDGHGGTATNTLTVTINGTNDAPTIGASTASVTEDTLLTATGSVPVPRDPDVHDVLSIQPMSNVAGTYGTLTLNADGTYTYTLNNSLPAVQALGAGERLLDVFTYTVRDNHGATGSNTLTVTINGTNDTPSVGNATATVTEDTQTTATGFLPSPTDPDAHDSVPFLPQNATAGLYGTLTLRADGSYTYALNNALPAVQALGVGETLSDTFTYTVSDGHGGTASNTLTVTISGTNDTPVASAAIASVIEDTQITTAGTLPPPRDIDIRDSVSFVPQPLSAGTYGTLTLAADGTYTYTLNNSLPAVQALGAGETLTDTLSYGVVDNHGAIGTGTLTVTISGTNDAPTATAAAASVTEDLALTATGVLPPPRDVDIHDTLSFLPKAAEPGLYGTLTLRADGSYTYTLNNALPAVQALGVGETLTDTFTYTVSDGHGGTGSSTLTITVNGTDDAPSVAAAAASVTEDTGLTASGTLPAPTDPDAHDTPVFIPKTAEAGLYGSLTLNADGTYTYTLNNGSAAVQALGAGEKLADTFTYTVSDGHGGTASNTLTLTINGTNDAPSVAAAADSVKEDVKLTTSGILPAPTDQDAHDTPVFAPKTAEAGLYGSLTLNADGSYTYTLNNALPAVQTLGVGETLTDTFTYTVSDGHGGTASNTLTLTINGTNDTPSVGPTFGFVTEDTLTVLNGALSTPTDPDTHDMPVFVAKTAETGLYGSLTLRADGTYTYTLNNSMNAVQGLGQGETLRDIFTYTVSDGHGGTASNVLTVIINGTNDAPAVAAAVAAVTEDAKLTAAGKLPTPTDIDAHDTVSFIPKTGEAGRYGTLTLNAAGAYTYTLNNSLSVVQALGQGESLSETFNYTVKDQHGGITVGTLTVNISGTNDLPVPTVQTASLTEDVKAVALGSLRPVPDPDVNDIVTFVPQSSTAGLYGTLTLNANGSYVYVLNNSSAAVQGLGPGESVTDTFAYAVSDGHGGTAASTLTLTINGTNDAPTVGTASASIGEEAAGPTNALSGLLPTPYDADIRDTVSFVPQTNRAGTWGTLTLRADGTYTYALTDSAALHSLGAGQIAYDTFAYTVADNHGASVSNTLTITVIGVNDAPSVASATASVQEDTLLTASGILPAPTDPDAGDRPQFVMQLSTQGQYGTLFLSPAGAYTYTLNNGLPAVHALGEGDTLTDTFTYTVTDGHGGTATNTLTVTINGTNDAPTVDAADAAITEGVAQTAGTLPTPQDPDAHDVPVFVPQTGAAGLYGSLTLDASGAYVYTLNNSLAVVKQLGLGETLTDTFTYTVTDNHGGTATNTLTVTVNGINTPPLTGTITAGSVTEDTSTVLTGIMTAPPDPNPHDTVVFLPQTGTAGAYGTLTLAASGRYTYVLNNTLPAVQGLGVGETLTDTLAATVSDGKGGLTQTTLAITINGTNDLPSVAPSSGAITEDTAILAGTLSLPTDPDIHDTPAFLPQLGTAGAYGTLTLNADGTYSYALNNSLSAVQGLGVGETLTDSFAYTVSDGHGGTASNTLTITISGANDAPAALAATASVIEDTALSASGVLPRPSDPDFHDTVAFIPLAARAGAYGTLTLAADGHYTYVLNNTLPAVQGLGVGETLTDTITYQVIDNHGATGSATLTVTINGTNDNPIVTPLTASILETAASVSGVLPAPTDPDIHDAPAYVPIAARAGIYGSLTLNADGSYTYVLNQSQPAVQGLGQGETLTDTFAYSVVDGHGGAASGTLTVTVNGINNPPTVAASAAVIAEHTPYVTGVLPSPDDPDIHDTVSFTPATLTGRYGTLSLDAHGGYVYTLNAHSPDVSGLGQGESLTDTITYGIADDKGGTGTGTLTVTINGTNDAPVLGPQAASVSVGGTVTAAGTLIAGDPDAHDTVSFTPFTAQAGLYGTLTLNADGTYAYTLNSGLSAVRQLSIGDTLQDVFLCQAQDQYGLTGSGTLTVTINGGNEAPTVAAATASVTEDLALTATGTLPAPQDINIHDAIGFVPLSAQAGTYGTLTLTAGGRYIYVLNNALPSVQALGTGETLTDTFTYQAIDNHGAIGSNTLTVTINGTNDAPTMSLAAAAFARTDLTLTGVLPPPHDPDAHDTASYQPLTAQAGLYGTLTLNADGTYTYVLNSTLDTVRELGAGESLQDVFSCTVIDSHGTTGAGVFTITINGSNDAPTAADATASVTAAVSGDQVLATGILPHPADPNIHDVLSFVPLAAEAGSYGTLTLAADGSWTYTLNNAADAVRQLGAGATLTDTITYQVADNHGATGNATLSVTIYGVNDLPSVAAATASVTEDTAAAASGILPAPTDPDSGDSVSFVPIAGGAGLFGTLNLDADGHYTYTLNNSLAAVQGLGEGQTLTDTFIYTVTDAHGGTGSNTLTVTINGVNDSPSVAAATADVTEDVQTLVTGTLPAPHDPDNYGVPNDILSFTPQIAEPGAYGSLTLNADGTYTYILNNALSAVQNLNAGDTLTDTFTYTVTDNHGGTGSNTLTVTIHGLDEPSGGGTYAAPQTASLSVTAETGEAVPPGTGTTSTLPDYLQPEGDSLASVLNHYASSGSGQGHETAATDGTPPEGGAAPNASPLPSSEDGGAPTVSAPTETAVHDAQPQQYSEPYTPPMESSTETLQQNVSQELARNGGI
ncbi:VCBS domain-containing protein [Bilophila wadsworthia]|uniref:VCBS domain-containing protein n=1 Tax=Bilophila wadsworthia TaxID=35833 RepID=UPI0026DC2EB5|nr:VCBS domain-containing protein [Bilophila wadsworthia]